MSDDRQLMNVFLDLLPNQPQNDQTRESYGVLLRERFEKGLPEAIERIWKLPSIVLKEPFGDYKDLLLEARTLFIAGYYYSCVAMCGIVGERLVKDVLRASLLIQKDGHARRPKDSAFDQFEHVDVNGIVMFLKETELLSDEAVKAANNLGQLRNRYAHARGKEPQGDAVKAINLLHELVEGTVSVFKDFEIKDGAFIRKADTPKVSGSYGRK